ncbi:MAG: sporulation membrane protein YtaF [Firmicutes bacterium]|nr:sporulation membrane protein YtaF [Bacillota bacterium]
MNLGALLFFAFALSLDAFSAGVAYGLRQIRISFGSHLVFGLASMLTVGLSMLCGDLVARFLPVIWGERLGGALLFGIGLWWYLRGKREKREAGRQDEHPKTVARLRFASLTVLVQILEEPACADLDASGTLSTAESLFLGFALSLDALGAGFGAALAGLNGWLAVCLVGFFQQLFLLLGIWVGCSPSLAWLRAQGSLLASIVLCLLGLVRFLQAG